MEAIVGFDENLHIIRGTKFVWRENKKSGRRQTYIMNVYRFVSMCVSINGSREMEH